MMAGRRAARGRGSGIVRGDSGGRGSGSGGRGDADDNGGRRDNNDSGDCPEGSGGRGDTNGSGVRGQSSGTGGGGEGSGTSARGGDNESARGGGNGGVGGGSRRGRRRTLRDDENSECLLWDDEGRQIVPQAVDADPRIHRTRGYSPGGFGVYPLTPTVVRIAGNQIDCPKALRNLLAIMRMYWPDGCAGAKEIDRKSPGFWNKCINEFLRYYTWDSKISIEDEARASILGHMRDNMRRTLADDRGRAEEKMASAKGTRYADHRPPYMKPGVWSRLAEYWESEEFKKKSAAGKKARKVVKVPHTSGARSFDRRRRDYIELHNGNLDNVVVYKDCHTLKDEKRKGEWITEEAKLIIERYIDLCRKKGVDPKATQIQSWIEAVGGVRKNKILGHPRLRPSDVYESDARPPRPRKGEGGSSGRSALARIQDDIFMRVVDETLSQARSNPEEYMLTPEQIRLLARDVVAGDSSLPPDHPITRETRHSIIRVAVEVLNNIYKTDGPGAAKGKAPTVDDDDFDDGGSNSESTESDEDRDISASPYDVVSRGGPVIRG